MSHDVIAEAIAFYDSLLQGEVLERTHEALQRITLERGLVYQGRTLYGALRPRFVTPEQQAEVQRAALAVNRALGVVYQRACQDEAFRRELRIQEWEELLMPVDARSRVPPVIGRLDGFVGPDGIIRFIEYNPSPGGPLLMQVIGDAFAATPAVEAFSRRYEVTFPRSGPGYADALKRNHARAGRSGAPRIVFFGPQSPEDSEEENLLRECLAAQGLPLDIVSPEDEWAHRNGRLYLRDQPVDVVTYIGANGFGALLMGCGEEHPVRQAIADGSASFMNGLFRFFVLRSKVLFAVLSTHARSGMFEPEIGAALDRHVPWTRVVREGKTRFGDKEIDLLPFVAEHRDQFVLKPAYEAGGKGVLLGWLADADAWSATLKEAQESPWVVQARVSTPRGPYPFYDNGRVRYEDRYEDMNPFVWNGERQEGCFVRLSKNAIVNLAAGGAVTPPLVIRKRG